MATGESLLNDPKAHNNDLNAAVLAFLDLQNQYPPYNPVSTFRLLSLRLVRQQELILKLLGGTVWMG